MLEHASWASGPACRADRVDRAVRWIQLGFIRSLALYWTDIFFNLFVSQVFAGSEFGLVRIAPRVLTPILSHHTHIQQLTLKQSPETKWYRNRYQSVARPR